MKDGRQTMRTTAEVAARALSLNERLSTGTETPSTAPSAAPHSDAAVALLAQVVHILDEAKAENIVTIDLAGKSQLGDYMVIASGRSDRHVGAIGDQVQRKLKEFGVGRIRIEGLETCDWVLIDAGDIIVHVFRPEVREFYKLEKMWSGDRPGDETAH
jgi:ribosome-associated protein